MIGLDTNILIRYLTQDDPLQSAKATTLVETRLSEANPGFVSIIVMVEIVWVLDRLYGVSAKNIAMAVERILQANVFVVEDEQDVFAAMIALREGHGSFADALIGARAVRAVCAETLTFDRKASRLPGFALL